jgi:DNA-binding Lrp family transcriptional regulator
LENVFSTLDLTIDLDSALAEPAITKQLRHAFVFINTESETYDNAIEDLRQIEGVNEVYPSSGAYEIIAKVSGESLEHLRELVFRRIKNISNIRSTLTLMVIDSPQNTTK